MFEFLTNKYEDSISIIKEDHKRVQDLFDRFEKADTRREKIKIAAEAIKELKLHAAIEEEIFYPAVRKDIENLVMNEADEEHHVAKVLIAELDGMNGKEDHYEAKFIVLAESVRHHIKEEEHNMLPRAGEIDAIDFDVLGREILARKQDLLKNGFPLTREEKIWGHARKSTTILKKTANKKTATKKSAKPYMQARHKNGHAARA